MRNALFLCTHNSARSVLSESILNHLKSEHLQGFSAGSTPKGTINPFALELLGAKGHDISALRSKSWDEFSGPDAPKIDFVFTLCDDAAAETCPYWPGAPIKDHWGMSDPSRVPGGDDAKRDAFAKTYDLLCEHMSGFIDLVALSPENELADRIKAFSEILREKNKSALVPHLSASV
ncbi:MAG: arsenate reductase ArsC [Pseudomonadota bacterium]